MRKDRLLKADIGTIISPLAPYLPCLGITSQGNATTKHVFNYLGKTVNDIVDEGLSNIPEKDSG